MQVLDGGRAFNGGNPPAEVSFNDAHVPNPQTQRAAANDSRRRAESVVQGPAPQVDRDVEDLGQFGRRARLARRPAEPAAGPDQGIVAEGHLRSHGQRRLRHGLRRARRDLRSRARREDHRLRHRLGRPPQLLGRICDFGTSARQVRAGRLELRRRVALERRHHGSLRAQSSERPIRCARCFSPIGPDGGEAGLDATTCC